MDGQIRSRDSLQSAIDKPVVGSFGKYVSTGGRCRGGWFQPGRLAEPYWTIRASLLAMSERDEFVSWAFVISSRYDHPARFVVEIARACAESDKSVLIVVADFSRAEISTAAALGAEAGLFDVLIGDEDAHISHAADIPGIDVTPVGRACNATLLGWLRVLAIYNLCPGWPRQTTESSLSQRPSSCLRAA